MQCSTMQYNIIQYSTVSYNIGFFVDSSLFSSLQHAFPKKHFSLQMCGWNGGKGVFILPKMFPLPFRDNSPFPRHFKRSDWTPPPERTYLALCNRSWGKLILFPPGRIGLPLCILSGESGLAALQKKLVFPSASQAGGGGFSFLHKEMNLAPASRNMIWSKMIQYKCKEIQYNTIQYSIISYWILHGEFIVPFTPACTPQRAFLFTDVWMEWVSQSMSQWLIGQWVSESFSHWVYELFSPWAIESWNHQVIEPWSHCTIQSLSHGVT